MLKRMMVALLVVILFFVFGMAGYSEPLPEPMLHNNIFLLGALDHDQVLHASNVDVIVYPASTTKILTALIVLERVQDLDETIVVDSESPYLDGSIIAINEGEIISYRDLLSGMLIASGNDAASALAIAIAGSIESFAALMNEKAVQLGCTNSHFVNPHGLHDENHYTTARDLYLIALECMKNETFREIVSTSTYEIRPTNVQPETRYLRTTNSLFFGADYSDTLVEVYGETVQTYYPNAIGIKTGYTEEAQRCLVAAASDENKGVIAIVMHSDYDVLYQDIIHLFEYGLHSFDFARVKSKGDFITEIQLNDPAQSSVGLAINSNLDLVLPYGTNLNQVEFDIQIGKNIAPPVTKNQVLGTIVARYQGNALGTAELVPIVDFTGDKLLNDQIERYGSGWKIDWKALGTNFAIFVGIWIVLYIALSTLSKKRRQKRPVDKD